MDVQTAHLLFEQSGTFKHAFQARGIPAFDYDIANDYGQTDYVVDLLQQIELAYFTKESVFDRFSPDDILFAFYPCIYFCENNTLFFNGSSRNFSNLTIQERNEAILIRSAHRQLFYERLLQLFTVCQVRGFRLILENPESPMHYLNNNFPYSPSLIDTNRQRRGDYYVKPTRYYFVNCTPTYGESWTKPKEVRLVRSVGGHKGEKCDRMRSEIAPEYAHNFLSDFIFGDGRNPKQKELWN